MVIAETLRMYPPAFRYLFFFFPSDYTGWLPGSIKWKSAVGTPMISQSLCQHQYCFVHLKDIMRPVEGKLDNSGISKAHFHSELAKVASSPFLASPKAGGWSHFEAGLALKSQRLLLPCASSFEVMHQNPSLPCCLWRPWSVEGVHNLRAVFYVSVYLGPIYTWHCIILIEINLW